MKNYLSLLLLLPLAYASATSRYTSRFILPVNGKVNSNNNIFSLGGTYDSMSNHPTNVATCLLAGDNPDNAKVINQSAILKFDQDQSLKLSM